MVRTKHTYILRRRREGKTDYRKRRNILRSRATFISPRITCKNTSVQFSTATPKGDRILASAHSRELYKLGWKGSGNSLPAAYLTGLTAGLKALKAGVKEAVLYTGLRRYIHGSRVSAVLKGVLDAGISVAADAETLPADERIRGEHISEYAKSLLEEDKKLYKRRFSKLVEGGLRPEEYPKHFDEVRQKVLKSYGVK
ncbi:MAG: 50S ribosomal protein L18 [Nitrososphaerales archaeon]